MFRAQHPGTGLKQMDQLCLWLWNEHCNCPVFAVREGSEVSVGGSMKTPARLWVGVPAMILFLSSATTQARELTFDDRVRAQKAIDRVAYGHLIGARETFEQAVPQEVLEARVLKYLKESVALETFWHRPITNGMLDSELRRIERQTQMPDRLEELYRALGGDSYLIKECLVRPELSDRLAHEYFASDARVHGEAWRKARTLRDELVNGLIDPAKPASGRREWELVREQAADRDMGRSFTQLGLDFGGATGLDEARLSLSAAQYDWWRGESPERVGEVGRVQNDHGRLTVRVLLAEESDRFRVAVYAIDMTSWETWWKEASFDPASFRAASRDETIIDHARERSRVLEDERARQAPSPQGEPLSAEDFASSTTAAAGEGTWDLGPTQYAVARRNGYSTVWTGTEMIVWGGLDIHGHRLDSGARYDPATDTWTFMSRTNAPAARFRHSAVWTGARDDRLGRGGGRRSDRDGRTVRSRDRYMGSHIF